ncbi:MAG: replication endonuclease, partial [Rhodoferax sp.]|nr:replication endonuclease [Rhodoferax sp.]
TLEALEVVNEAGDALNLQEVADKSVSNPSIRRGELMVRARGFEEVAEFKDHQAYFLTLTCPSRFHRFSALGKSNPLWTGETPREGQDWLCDA